MGQWVMNWCKNILNNDKLNYSFFTLKFVNIWENEWRKLFIKRTHNLGKVKYGLNEPRRISNPEGMDTIEGTSNKFVLKDCKII